MMHKEFVSRYVCTYMATLSTSLANRKTNEKTKLKCIGGKGVCTFGSFKCILRCAFQKEKWMLLCTFCFSKCLASFFSFFHMNLVNVMGKKMLNEVLMDLYTRFHLLCKAFLK
jgi:hypothetical protein